MELSITFEPPSLLLPFQGKIEFMTKHHRENDTKNKKQISELKTDNKNKERDLKKFENDLKRATDKVALLEEKVVAIKADFKTKEEETKQEHQKRISNFEDKIREFRKNLQNKEDELSNTKTQLKEAHESIQRKDNETEDLRVKLSNTEKELQKEILSSARQAEETNLRHSKEMEDFQKILGAKEDLLCDKECRARDLEKTGAQLREDLEERTGELETTTRERLQTEEKLQTTSLSLTETRGVLEKR